MLPLLERQLSHRPEKYFIALGTDHTRGQLLETWKNNLIIIKLVSVRIVMVIDRGQFFLHFLRVQIIRAAQIIKAAVIVPELGIEKLISITGSFGIAAIFLFLSFLFV